MLPVVLLTGFLGSGKTTLLRRLAGAGRARTAVLLNERGLAGTDDIGGLPAELVELSDRCACCVDQAELLVALERFAARGDLDRAVIETTGLADPLPIAWAVGRPELDERIALEAIVTVVDACNFESTRGPEWTAQVRAADVVVVTKLDVAPAGAWERAAAAVRGENGRARVVTAHEAMLLLDEAGSSIALRAGDVARGRAADAGALAERATGERPIARHGDFTEVTYSSDARLGEAALLDLLEALPEAVYRAKGIARVAHASDAGERWLSFHVVGDRVHVERDVAAPAHGETRMIFFGRALASASLSAAVDGCRHDGSRPRREPDRS